MNTKNIQTFLMVSAAFFAMSAPVRSANAVGSTVRLAHVAPVRVAAERATPAAPSVDDEQQT
ncbi:hypothetical protein [Paraburkholderia sp.]|uniref:hypothetical protein n=1 Tax=Paraburkholderia sp. TaxID=1926495 RepID=UPI0023913505|nr:hypothetical protein [Paraburkholderia sp.]MDE1181144.1 hypothetical protein [Paraburkholderia sp.]